MQQTRNDNLHNTYTSKTATVLFYGVYITAAHSDICYMNDIVQHGHTFERALFRAIDGSDDEGNGDDYIGIHKEQAHRQRPEKRRRAN